MIAVYSHVMVYDVVSRPGCEKFKSSRQKAEEKAFVIASDNRVGPVL